MQLQGSSFSGTSLSTISTQQRLSIRAPMQIQAAQTLQGKVREISMDDDFKDIKCVCTLRKT